jgi:hypothetical protein
MDLLKPTIEYKDWVQVLIRKDILPETLLRRWAEVIRRGEDLALRAMREENYIDDPAQGDYIAQCVDGQVSAQSVREVVKELITAAIKSEVPQANLQDAVDMVLQHILQTYFDEDETIKFGLGVDTEA